VTHREGVPNTILKVLVGSRAHGMFTESSDYDYRGVFVQPTADILKLGGTIKNTSWIEGREPTEAGRKEDDTAWEIGHFLNLATHCNPSILEVFAAPIEEATEEGRELQSIFPAIWNPKGVRDAFIGYGLNQRKKLLENKDSRPWKYACAYLRTLIQAEQLLSIGVLPVNLRHHEEYGTLMMFKNKIGTPGAVIDKCLVWHRRVEALAEVCTHEPDLEKVNDFLMRVRSKHWTGQP